MLFSPHTVSSQEEQTEVADAINKEEIEEDEVWSQFKRKLPKDSQEKFVFVYDI